MQQAHQLFRTKKVFNQLFSSLALIKANLTQFKLQPFGQFDVMSCKFCANAYDLVIQGTRKNLTTTGL